MTANGESESPVNTAGAKEKQLCILKSRDLTRGGDVHLIETLEQYPSNYDEVISQNHNEMNIGISVGEH